MDLTGLQILGAEMTAAGTQLFRAVNPVTGEPLEPAYREALGAEVERAVALGEAAFDRYRTTDCETRAEFLETIAGQLEECGEALIARAHLETGLPTVRLQGELGRTLGQLRLFADLVRTGEWQDVTIDPAIPDRQPQPKPDLRRRQVALGPVAVFGVSNFPLAFSVPGGDTASALAAGCPVVVKGHPAHPGTSELAGRAIQTAVAVCGLPEGTFSLLQGRQHEIGGALVRHPLIKAVAFTGSLQAGRALFDMAAARPEPIPVFAEMGSVNPVFLLPEKLEQAAEQLAEAYVASLTLGVGQFCTSPGVVFALRSDGLDNFLEVVSEQLQRQGPGVLLHAGIKQNYLLRLAEVRSVAEVAERVTAEEDEGGTLVRPALFQVAAEAWLANPLLAEEIFGPAALVVACDSAEQLYETARQLRGQLTATLHGTTQDLTRFADLVPLLERKAGRILCNGFPTGVEVSAAMMHGGPYPASTDSRFTSVGTAAITRFLRPVCYQNFPANFLPDPLQPGNPA